MSDEFSTIHAQMYGFLYSMLPTLDMHFVAAIFSQTTRIGCGAWLGCRYKVMSRIDSSACLLGCLLLKFRQTGCVKYRSHMLVVDANKLFCISD
jgi:hypothetical protein